MKVNFITIILFFVISYALQDVFHGCYHLEQNTVHTSQEHSSQEHSSENPESCVFDKIANQLNVTTQLDHTIPQLVESVVLSSLELQEFNQFKKFQAFYKASARAPPVIA